MTTTDTTATTMPTSEGQGRAPEPPGEALYALWDRLRAEAISPGDREEIDAVFARALP